jgi:hypothetical protein
MKFRSFLIALAFLAFPAAAQEWITISNTAMGRYDAQAGSLERTTNLRGVPIVALTLRLRKPDGLISFERNYVSVQDCSDGNGKLVTVNLNGVVLYSNDFLFGGGNVASNIAELICEVAFPNTVAPAEREQRPVRRGESRL